MARRAQARALAAWATRRPDGEAFSGVWSSTLQRAIDTATPAAEALGLGVPKTLEEEIAELRQGDKVDAELAALKARLGRGTGGEG